MRKSRSFGEVESASRSRDFIPGTIAPATGSPGILGEEDVVILASSKHNHGVFVRDDVPITDAVFGDVIDGEEIDTRAEEGLSEELLLIIFSYLPSAVELCTAACVNRRWNRIAQEDCLWRNLA